MAGGPVIGRLRESLNGSWNLDRLSRWQENESAHDRLIFGY